MAINPAFLINLYSKQYGLVGGEDVGNVNLYKIRDTLGETLLTEVQLSRNNKVMALSAKKYQVYMVEDSVPPTEFPQTQ
ncbi:MAG: hypothetical protein KDD45_08455 [Bdellovibrionales bacterium]|nr:hypothetical protein [Bdellovibrionales bacterium]